MVSGKHIHWLLLSCFWLLYAPLAFAQQPAPGLFPSAPFNAPSLPLQKLDIRSDVLGKVACTTVELHFKGGASATAKTEFLFPISPDQTLLSCTIETKAPFRAGALEFPQWKSVSGIPAQPNQLSTPAQGSFPIHPVWLHHPGETLLRIGQLPTGQHDTRITLCIKQELEREKGDFVLQIPVQCHVPADSFRLRVQAHQQAYLPIGHTGKLNRFRFKRYRNNYRAATNRLNFTADEPIEFFFPITYGLPFAWFGPEQDSIPFVLHIPTQSEAATIKKPKQIQLLWDASLNGSQRNQIRDLQLLGRLFKSLGNVNVKLTLFDHRIRHTQDFPIQQKDWDDLDKVLSECKGDGATDVQGALKSIPPSDLVLLFTGHPLPPNSPPNHHSPTFFIYQGTQPEALVAAQWGLEAFQAINLQTIDPKTAFNRIRSQPLQVSRLKFKPKHLHGINIGTGSEVDGGITFSGSMTSKKAPLQITFGHAGKPAEKIKFKLEPPGEEPEAAHIVQLLSQPPLRAPQVFPNSLSDFHVFGGEAPGSWSPWLATLRSWEKASAVDAAQLAVEQRAWNREQYTEDWEVLREVWKGNFDPSAKLPEPLSEASDTRTEPSTHVPEATLQFITAPTLILAGDSLFDAALPSKQFSRIRSVKWVAGGSIPAHFGPESRNGILWVELTGSPLLDSDRWRKIPDWEAEAPYLKNRYGNATRAYSAYVRHLPEWQAHPSFFLDWADVLLVEGQTDAAVRVLSNFKALQQEEPVILRAAAHRLQAWGAQELALEYFQTTAANSPNDPIALRDLALALEAMGQPEAARGVFLRALDLDSDVMEARFPGIGRILLREFNHLATQYQQAGDTSRLPASFPAPMSLDFRVTCDWNRSDTDVDLLVTDPDGILCDYDQPVTPSGGAIAGDVTDGFGPEEFSIRNAKKGEYTIEIEYEDNPERRISGPTFVLVTIFTDYGSSSESKKTIPLRLTGKSGTVEAARVSVE